MGIYLNPGNDLFKRAVDSEVYIDKSMIIAQTNRVLNTEQLYITVSRPRRFGKSMAANMLAAYYDRTCDSHDIFDKLDIAQAGSYEKYLNSYDVIKINIQDFLSGASDVEEMIGNLQKKLLKELGYFYDEIRNENDLIDALQWIYAYKKLQFVFIIDEWDCVLREKKYDEEGHKKYLDFLRYLFKDKPYAALVYMTGILPIKKYGSHSALNIFNEYSMVNQGSYAQYTGFTEDEVIKYCEKYHVDFDSMKEWYDGYYLSNIGHIYNPRAVVCALTSNSFQSYWTRTETYEALKVYIETNMDGLKDAILRMIAGHRELINPEKFQNDMTNFASKDDVLTLLVHLGYVAFDEKESKVYIPNYEIRGEFKNAVEGADWKEVVSAINTSEKLLEYTWNQDCEKVAGLIKKTHSEFTSILKYHDENSLTCVLSIAYFNAMKYYTRVYELPTGQGFADIAFIPKKNIDKPALLIELKHDKSAMGAINQIKDKNYCSKLEDYKGNLLMVGINYDVKNRDYQCIIEKC